MCDTLVKLSDSRIIFGKNSDRSPNEPNLTVFIPARTGLEESVRCTYTYLGGVPSTHAVLLVRPSWMWGGEMGINDAGVMIGNEAVFTRSKGKKIERLLGMDLLRLALERAGSAEDAVDVLENLLDQHGQGGNCGFDKPFFYDNSFLVCDHKNAYILETSGLERILKKVRNAANISNRLCVDSAFTKRHSEPVFTHFSGSLERMKTAGNYLSKDPFDVASMMEALQSHHPKDLSTLYRRGSVKSVCMHKSFLGDHTTGSMIVETRDTFDTIWLTGCSTPCLSLYKPTYFGLVVPPVFMDPKESLGYWLEREYLVRAVFAGLIHEPAYKAELARIQKEFIEGDALLAKSSPAPDLDHLRAFAEECARKEQAFVDSFQSSIDIAIDDPMRLPSPWNFLTSNLGSDVFEPRLMERKKS